MKKERSRAQRVIDFFEGKGFYIILFLCVAAIGISGYVLFFANLNVATPSTGPADYLLEQPDWTPEPIEDLSSLPPVEVVAPTTVVLESPSPTPKSTQTPTKSPTSTPRKTGTQTYVWPIKGRIVVPYAMDELIYDSTMGDWRTHPGLDIEAAMGAKVCSVADGEIEEIYEDELMGTTVVVLHDDGVRSVYANLVKKPTVSVSQRVSAGDVIGAVGDTALAEWGVVSHLHLEIIRDGKQINPAELLPSTQ